MPVNYFLVGSRKTSYEQNDQYDILHIARCLLFWDLNT